MVADVARRVGVSGDDDARVAEVVACPRVGHWCLRVDWGPLLKVATGRLL